MASIFSKLIDKAALARVAQPVVHRLLLRLSKRLADRGFGTEADWTAVFTSIESIVAEEVVSLLTSEPDEG